ncbi:Hypothetical Protein RradSPS_3105 (plasmid) [Rubrobacter radiotolerans]|uniref:Uncharacterized protein n=1 Tax=Rubrobacter radiotolerans TaxID=42256 RepID=A0A023X7R9_RUBRA|nr:Hypothetical Protein RradSPS_3105 [Rubrobacter radiotolerans]
MASEARGHRALLRVPSGSVGSGGTLKAVGRPSRPEPARTASVLLEDAHRFRHRVAKSCKHG